MNVMPATLPPSVIQTVQTVYGSLLHHRAELAALGDAAHQGPYNAPPKAPVLYIKPANTHNAFGQSLHWPAAQAQICARACLGMIFQPNRQLAGIKYTQSAIKNIVIEDWQIAVLCDFALPHTSFYRPPLRFNALDGSLALPQHWLSASASAMNALQIEIWINGKLAYSYSSADWACSSQEQLASVSEFIAWEAGDVLMLGCPPDVPLAKIGDVVETRMNGQVFTQTQIKAEAA